MLDFGNIVAGKKVELKFDIYNFNKTSVTFTIERKELATMGYVISTANQGDKFSIDPFSFITLNITHETNAKNLASNKNTMKITMKDREVYEIELFSFVAIPDLKLSINEVKFDKVYIGRKKIMRYRIENITKVPVKWNIVNRDPMSKKLDKEGSGDTEIFTISPMFDRLEPGKKKTITVSFVPQKSRVYKSKYEFIIDDNPRHLEFFLDGSGADLELKIIPESLNIGPVLPYYKYALDYVELHNPNDIDIDVYSLDFDENYLQEEDCIRYYYHFIKHPNTYLDLDIRNAGDALWKKFSNYSQKLNDKLNEVKQLKTEDRDAESQKEVNAQNANANNINPLNLNNSKISSEKASNINIYNKLFQSEKDKKIEKMEIPEPEEEMEIKIQPQIESHQKYNVICIGPEKSGISSILKEQRKYQYRGIVSIKNILDWNEQNNFHETCGKVKIYQQEKNKELEFQKAEKEKLIKQAKAKKQKIDETPIDEKKYMALSRELMTELIKNRLSKPDCNVGAVFDDFTTELIESEEILLEIIEDLLKNENLIFSYFNFPKDEENLDVCNFIDWRGISENYSKEKAAKKALETITTKGDIASVDKKSAKNSTNLKGKGTGGKFLSTTSVNATNNNFHVKTGGGTTGGFNSPINKEKLNTTNLITSGNRQDTILALQNFYGSILNIPNALDFSCPKKYTEEEIAEYNTRKENLLQKFMELKTTREQINLEKIEPSSMHITNEEKFFNKSIDDISKHSEQDKNNNPDNNNDPNVNFNQSNIDSKNFESSHGGNLRVSTKENFKNEKPNLERKILSINFEYYLPLLLCNFCRSIPNPKLPDPEDLPLPPDEEYQIIKRPIHRPDRPIINSFFIKTLSEEYPNINSIEEIVDLLVEEDKRVEEMRAAYLKEKAKGGKAVAAAAPKKGEKEKPQEKEIKAKDILVPKSRWLIKKGQSVKFLVGFFCKEVAIKPQSMSFEIMTYPPKEFKLNLTGISDYPSLSTIPSNIFMNKNKHGAIGLMNRKRNYEEDFGYILITKDSERKNIEKYKETNCKYLRFTNNGKFDLRVDFVFLSSLNTEGLGFNLFLGSNTDAMNQSHSKDMKAATKAPQIVEPTTPFLLTQNFLEIKKEETKLLQVNNYFS
jgi:hypothetical protein